MRKYDITADVQFKINWMDPAKNIAEITMRDQAQIRLDVKAHDFSEALKMLLSITTLREYGGDG